MISVGCDLGLGSTARSSETKAGTVLGPYDVLRPK